MRAKKSLGQNFLTDSKVLSKIITAGQIARNETIIEVGPGKGVLTKVLLEKATKVIAIEKDDDLIPYLETKFSNADNLELVHQDVLNFTPPATSYKVIANIPYYITSPIITKFLNSQNQPTLMVLLVQKEVAEKICDPKHESVLSLSVKIFGEPKLICTVPPKAFKPAPKVDSAVLQISNIHQPDVHKPLELLAFIKKCFNARRKTILNNLKNGLQIDKDQAEQILTKAKIAELTRPGQLTIQDWDALRASAHSLL